MKRDLSGTWTIAATNKQLCCDLRDEAVVLDLDSGVYYGLNSVGTHVWHLIQRPRTVDEIIDSVAGNYDVEPGCCGADVMAFLHGLLDERLAEVVDEPAD